MGILKRDLQRDAAAYSGMQVMLHWLSAVVIIWTLMSAGYVLVFEVGDSVAGTIANFNVALTTLFIPFFLLRCYYRWRFSETGGLVGWIHLVIYGITGSVLLTGVLMMSRPIDLFGWVLIPQPLDGPVLLGVFSVLHKIASSLLAGLVTLHVVAVIWHECNGRRILRRMWFSAD